MKKYYKIKLYDKIIIYVLILVFGFLIFSYLIYQSTPYCSYTSDNVDIKGKCFEIALMFENEDFYSLVVADYDFNNLPKLMRWYSFVEDYSRKLNLNETEKQHAIYSLNTQVQSMMNVVHNKAY